MNKQGAIAKAFDDAGFEPPMADDEATGTLPSGCPIEPLGKNVDDYFYMDQTRQLRVLSPKDHSRNTMISLLGSRQDWAWLYYEGKKEDKSGDWVGTGKLRTEKLGDDLMLACAQRGVWDPHQRLRESGAWPGGDGGLVLHCGDAILAGGKWHQPGRIGEHVYPAQPPTPRPDPRPQGCDPALELMAMLETWSWSRPGFDARLLLGWIGVAMVGGALDWRPPVWVSGGAGTGKSTLQKMINHVLGALVYSSDPTAAGIWQKLGLKTLPVALDEIELEEDGRQVQRVIKLARQAASGGVVLRGGDSHKATEFKAQSAFLFSSILIPPLLPADKSRIAILDLKKLPDGAPPPQIVPDKLGALGSRLLGRLVQHYGKLPAVLTDYRQYLAALGLDARGCDGFGTLLAVADLLLTDHPGAPTADEPWVPYLEKARLSGVSDDDVDDRRCLMHLLTSPLDMWSSGTRKTVADVVSRYNAAPGDAHEDNRKLMSYGVGVFDKKEGGKVLAVANDHRALAHIFRDSHWAAKAGAGGGWVQSLRRLPNAEPGQQRFDGIKIRCTEIPLSVVFREEE